MVSMDIGNAYITNGSVSGDTITGGTTVHIQTVKLDDNTQNQLIEFNIPVSPGAFNSKAPESNLIDLKRIKNVISIQGFLATDSTGSAYTKKQNLYVLGGMGGTNERAFMSGKTIGAAIVTVVWGQSAQSRQQKVTGAIIKIMTTETAGLMVTDSTSETHPVQYAVQIQIAVGKSRYTA